MASPVPVTEEGTIALAAFSCLMAMVRCTRTGDGDQELRLTISIHDTRLVTPKVGSVCPEEKVGRLNMELCRVLKRLLSGASDRRMIDVPKTRDRLPLSGVIDNRSKSFLACPGNGTNAPHSLCEIVPQCTKSNRYDHLPSKMSYDFGQDSVAML